MIRAAMLRMGRGASRHLGDELGRYVVTTMPDPWAAVEPGLGKAPEKVFLIDSMERVDLDKLVAQVPPADYVVGAGGGRSVDAAKYLSWKLGLPLVTVPTVISVDAFVTPAIGIREQSRVRYVGDVPSSLLVVDFDVIRGAPRELNIAGVSDILSCHTGCFDWEVACRDGVNDYPLDPLRIAQARALVGQIANHTGDFREMNERAIKTLVDAYIEEVEICLPVDHYRAEEGSEHFLAYAIEAVTRRPYLHGALVGLGIDVMAGLQGNDHAWIVGVMDEAGLPRTPRYLGLDRDSLRQALERLPRYVKEEKLWYSIIESAGVPPEFVEKTLARLRF